MTPLPQNDSTTWVSHSHGPIACSHFPAAITKYEEALDTNPNDYQALIRCAEIAVQFIEGHARGVAAMKYSIETVRAETER